MSTKKKAIIIAAALVGLITIVVLSKSIQSKDEEAVQTSRVQSVATLESKVTASGEVRPDRLYNITAEVNGRVEQLFVSEGDSVKKGQPLVRIDPTQLSLATQGAEAGYRTAQSDTSNQQVAVEAAKNAVQQARSNLGGAKADLARDQATLRFNQNEFNRNQQLVENGVISKSVFDQVRSQYDAQVAVVSSQEARVTQLTQQVADAELNVQQAVAALHSSESRVKQAKAGLDQQLDFLKRTNEYSPIDGVVSSLPVKVGEFALANFSTTPLLTIADMSKINAEIKVDETDIANVAIGQHVKVKVDALGDTEIDGEVYEKGSSAVTRSGITISQTAGSDEAKDFIVKVRLNPTPEIRAKLRPGMSSTAVITTATVHNVLAIPLQAIVPRDLSQNGPNAKGQPSPTEASGVVHSKEVDGVFVFGADRRAHFVPVVTGIKGDQNIEVKSGLTQGQEIVTGPYKTLRTLKEGSAVKRELKPLDAADAKPSPAK